MTGRTAAVMSTLILLVACAGHPEQVRYELAASRAEWLDRFRADSRACARTGGVIVRERYFPDSLHRSGAEPETGTRYGCAR